ncbi:MAG: phosphatidylglycerophosphatase A [Candidatus Acidiferrales bacterium]|jgi:phosphatidylglycerophosphatase A
MSASAEPQASAGDSPTAAAARKPRFALFVATACGLGYLPKAPGTWGSLGGLLIAMLPVWIWLFTDVHFNGASASILGRAIDPLLCVQCLVAIAVATIGVWSADRAASFWGQKDPQRVVIDEVSGQHLTLLLGCAIPQWWKAAQTSSGSSLGFITMHSTLNWKYLLVGFILFRVFDIWKPFPARQAESLPGGWGIMADDWVAGIYAAIGLWIARAAGL